MHNRYIENIVEPKELFLMWKDGDGDQHKVGVLKKDSFTYLPENSDEMRAAFKAGFRDFPAFRLDKPEHKNPIPVFMRRCPPKSRTDYDTYLKAFLLDPESDDVQNISDFTLLGYTGACVPLNPFILINPFSDQAQPFEFTMQIADAHRHYFSTHSPDEDVKGKNLQAKEEPDNDSDPNAIVLALDEEKFGYVPQGLNTSFIDWLEKDRVESINIFHVNGRAQHRNAYAFVKITAEK